MPVHTAQRVQAFLAKSPSRSLLIPPSHLTFLWKTIFLFPTLKRELTGISLTQKEIKNNWEGVDTTLIKDNFIWAFQRLIEQLEMLEVTLF